MNSITVNSALNMPTTDLTRFTFFDSFTNKGFEKSKNIAWLNHHEERIRVVSTIILGGVRFKNSVGNRSSMLCKTIAETKYPLEKDRLLKGDVSNKDSPT